MAKMIFDEDGLLEEPCLYCHKAYFEDISHEWRCDEKECLCVAKGSVKEEISDMPLPEPYKPESESKRYMELAKSYAQGLRAGLAERW